MRVLRVYHAGGNPAHRGRDQALLAAGVDVEVVVPSAWEELGVGGRINDADLPVHQLPVRRVGDVNRHRYEDADVLRVLAQVAPDVLDLHEEPFSAVVRQWLRLADLATPVVGYSAQNLDKRWPPPFHGWERQALTRMSGMYPCSRQAASVLRGKGFRGTVTVLPLGLDRAFLSAGTQSHDDDEWMLLLVGRLVPEKGVLDAVRVLAQVRDRRAARLVVVGEGPQAGAAKSLASALGVSQHVDVRPWVDVESLAELYRASHVTLVPSSATRTWVEQFGRVILEAQGCGSVVCAYASGSIPEVAGGLAPLAAEGDSAALGAAAVALTEGAEEWHRLRTAGLERAGDFSWQHVAEAQAALYETALTGNTRLPIRSAQRGPAVAEFGPPARISGADRPFALPLLREDRGWTRAAARGLDLATSLRARSSYRG